MNNENNLGSIISVVVIGAVAITGILFGGKDITTTEIVDKTTIDRDYETIDRSIETATENPEYLGGLVHHVQEIFVAGIKAGSSETEVINSSGQWVYQINGTTGAFSSTLTVGGTSTLTGDLIVNTDDLYVDVSEQMVGIGTTTPGTMLEIYGSVAGTGIAPYLTFNSPTTTDTDFGLVFEDYDTQVFTMFFDDSANVFVFATSTDQDVITIDNNGAIVLNDSTTISGAATLSSTLTVTGESNLDTLIYGGDATQLFGNATATAAQVCDSSILKFATVGDATTTIQLATGATLIADCLTTIGDTKELLLYQNSTSTSGDGDQMTLVADPTSEILLEYVGGAVIFTKDKYIRIIFTNIDDSTTTVEVYEMRDAD